MISLKSILTDKMIQEESCGEVENMKLFNFKEKKIEPVNGGLFCEKIFGTLKDFTCKCGITKIPNENEKIICSKCGVQYTRKFERRNRFGHIYFRKVYYINPFILHDVLNIFKINYNLANKIAYNKTFFNFVEDKKGNIESFDGKKYIIEIKKDGESYSIAGIYDNLIKLNIDPIKSLQNCNNEFCNKYLNLGLHLFNFFNSYILVTPPAFRDIYLHDDKVSYDLKNTLYLKLIRSSIRLKSLDENKIPNDAQNILIYQESVNIQNLINFLFIKEDKIFYKNTVNPILKDLVGKEGLIRRNILGKRVDYSGRSLIIPDPTLDLDTIKIPEYIAYVILKPFIIAELIKYFKKDNINLSLISLYLRAKNEYKENTDISRKILYFISKNHRVLLNRNPTLHRYGIFGFKFIPYDGDAIKINGLICSPFNADFDGDQMGVYLCLSRESRNEVKSKLNVISNLKSSKDINCLNIKPSHEAVVGAFILSRG